MKPKGTHFNTFRAPLGQSEGSILLVSRFDEDLVSLLRIVNGTDWNIYWYATPADAIATLNKRAVSVVICDRELPGGCWTDMMKATATLVNPPPLIVADRSADERLWAEVLNLGGYDLLIKPFDEEEVLRVVSSACRSLNINASRRNGISAA